MQKEDWQNYEELTANLVEALGHTAGIKIVCRGANCMIRGKSGNLHQFDVLTSHSDGLISYRTAIECKLWNKKVNKDVVLKMHSIMNDTDIDKGVIVSNVGFTKDAMKSASHNNIALLELRKPTEEDWKGKIKNIEFQISWANPKITGVDLIATEESNSAIKRLQERQLKDGKLFTEEGKFVTPNGGEISLFQLTLAFQELLKEDGKVIEKNYHYPKGTIFKYFDHEFKCEGIKFKGVLVSGKPISVEIRGEEEVPYVLKNIFDGTDYTIFKNGKIKKRKNRNSEE